MKGFAIGACLGLALGAAGGWYGSTELAKGLPWMEGDMVTTTVVAKVREKKRLLLTLSTKGKKSRVLASFTKSAEEVDRLVEEGDKLVLRLPPKGPIAENPSLVSVSPPERQDDDEQVALQNLLAANDVKARKARELTEAEPGGAEPGGAEPGGAEQDILKDKPEDRGADKGAEPKKEHPDLRSAIEAFESKRATATAKEEGRKRAPPSNPKS